MTSLVHVNAGEVLVTDGFWRKSLSATRSLGKASFVVHALGSEFFSMSHWSRYTTKRVRVTDASRSPFLFGRSLIGYLLKQHFSSKPVLLPMEDATVQWVAENKDMLARLCRFIVPSKEALLVAKSKALTSSLASKLGIPSIDTFSFKTVLEFQDKIGELKSNGLIDDYLIKPDSGSGALGIIYPENIDSYDFSCHWNRYGPLLIQRRLPPNGEGVCVCVLLDESGKCVANFTHRRIYQYPVSGGASTQRISMHDDQLLSRSLILLNALRWTGIAMVEWKADITDGEVRLMEINGRPWGGIETAIRAGIDFPVIYANCCKGIKCDKRLDYEDGIKTRWFIPGDILRYLATPSSAREGLKEFLDGLPSSADEWDPCDIRGTLACIACYLFTLLRPRYWKFLRR